MRISLAGRHRYPAIMGGPSGGHILDCLAKGLGEMGHDVHYYLEQGLAVPLPLGVTAVPQPVVDAEIIHVHDQELFHSLSAPDQPWLRTCHTDVAIYGMDRALRVENAVYVSATLARTYGSTRYVVNGIVPDEYVFSQCKSGYFLFVCVLERALMKGLETAFRIAKAVNVPLVVAGYSWNEELVRKISRLCAGNGATFVGPVFGAAKANLFSEARALLFPTKWNEGFGLVMAEALMSGTPVICSDQGACRELITPDVGYVCADDDQYTNAAENVWRISPQACRERALRQFHYRRMTEDYLNRYEETIRSPQPVKAATGRRL